jgi:hypothetical protein
LICMSAHGSQDAVAVLRQHDVVGDVDAECGDPSPSSRKQSTSP